MHLLERRAKDNIIKAADAHGIPGIRLDGNNVDLVFREATDAVRRARFGDGPTLLECCTYRWRGHVGPSWDMDVGVKRKDELKEWLPKDPILRSRTRLADSGVSEEQLKNIEHEVKTEVEDSVVHARSAPFPDKAELSKHLFFGE